MIPPFDCGDGGAQLARNIDRAQQLLAALGAEHGTNDADLCAVWARLIVTAKDQMCHAIEQGTRLWLTFLITNDLIDRRAIVDAFRHVGELRNRSKPRDA